MNAVTNRDLSQHVSIPQWCDCCTEFGGYGAFSFNSFNPTMVRLLRYPCHFLILITMLFQSHNGAIAAIPSCSSSVRIRYVSIPQWCDCCSKQHHANQPTCPVSIPQWCDCCSRLILASVLRFLGFNPTMVRLLRPLRRKEPEWQN